MKKVILASQSPRRRELLSLLFDDFDVIATDCDESVPKDIDVRKVPEILAIRKNEALDKALSKDALVISCDTIVTIDGVILGKPKNKADAKNMMKMLSNRTHEVISGVCISYGGKKSCFSQVSQVSFYELSESEILNYIESDEPYDKAGGYGIQGKAGVFVKSICGDYFNIVGLPVARLKREIEKLVKE